MLGVFATGITLRASRLFVPLAIINICMEWCKNMDFLLYAKKLFFKKGSFMCVCFGHVPLYPNLYRRVINLFKKLVVNCTHIYISGRSVMAQGGLEKKKEV